MRIIRWFFHCWSAFVRRKSHVMYRDPFLFGKWITYRKRLGQCFDGSFFLSVQLTVNIVTTVGIPLPNDGDVVNRSANCRRQDNMSPGWTYGIRDLFEKRWRRWNAKSCWRWGSSSWFHLNKVYTVNYHRPSSTLSFSLAIEFLK